MKEKLGFSNLSLILELISWKSSIYIINGTSNKLVKILIVQHRKMKVLIYISTFFCTKFLLAILAQTFEFL